MVTIDAILLTAATSLTLSSKRISHHGIPPCNLPLTCPLDSGCVANSAQDNEYVVTCDMDFYGGDLYLTQTETLENCLLACSTANLCIGVSYKEKNCYLKREITSHEDGYGVRPEYPYKKACPLEDVDLYCENAGFPYKAGCFSSITEAPKYVVRCGRGMYGGDAGMEPTETLANCIEMCQNAGKNKWGAPNCVAVSWRINQPMTPDGWGTCYMKNRLGETQFKLDETTVILLGDENGL